MANLKEFIYLSNEDYETLVSTGTVVIQGDTLTYDPDNYVYVTPEKLASTTEDGLMSAADKSKLDGIAAGAQANVIESVKVNGTALTPSNKAVDITSIPSSIVTGLATVATSGSYNDLSNKPTIPTVNNGTLSIQGDGTIASTFTANQSGNTTLNIKGSGGTTVTKSADNEITISSTDNNNNQKVKAKNNGTDVTFGNDDVVEIKAGSNITVSASSTDKTITIAGTADTGATSVETTGSGNAVTTASYDSSTRKLTLTKGTTFLTSESHVGDVVSVAATTNSGIAIGGTTANPTVGIDSNHKLPTTTEWDSKLDKKPDGTNDLISNNKISTTYIPDIILGQLIYGGTVTGAGVATLSTNAKTKLGTTDDSITLVNSAGTKTSITGWVANEGIYYIVSSNGSFALLGLVTGDWLISTGSAWKKVDNTDAVTSVNGQTGAVSVGTITGVTVGGSSVATSGVATINTNTAYDATGNKIATMADIPSGEVDITFNGTATSTTENLTNIVVDTKTYTIPQGTYSKPSGGIPAADLAETYVTTTSANYIKSASTNGNTLTLTKGNDGTVTFTPSFTDHNQKVKVSGQTSFGADDEIAIEGSGGTSVTKGTGKITISSPNITVSATNGVSDGTNTYKYTLPSSVVQDSNYAHITVTSSSVSDGTATFNKLGLAGTGSATTAAKSDHNHDTTYQAKFGNQDANKVYAGPSSGSAAAPGFRALAKADLPTLTAGDVGALPDTTTYVSSVNNESGAITNVAKTNADNNFSVAQTMAGADVSGGTLKVNALNAKTSSSSTTYGPGTSGQVLKSNGTSAYWGSDSSDTTSQGIGGNYKWKNPMAGYQVFIADRDNKLVPMVTGASGTASTGTSKTMNTQAFDPFGLVGYTSSSSYRAADALCSNSTWLATASLDLRYSFNCGSTLTANAPVYIVAQLQSDGTAKLASPYYTQTLPSSADGKIYIYLGQAISTTNLNLQNDHPIYQYIGGALRQYIDNSFARVSASASAVSGATEAKSLNINGTSWNLPTGGGGTGSVTSVGLSLPSSEFTITNSPVTTSGTLTGSWKTQNANKVFAGPASGNDAAPTFRSIVAADLPVASANAAGIVSAGNQSFAGIKTFTSRPQLSFTPKLPSTYQEVKYIQASGSQYIDTGFKTTTEKLKVEFACAFPFGIAGMSLMGSNSPYNLVPYGNGNNTIAHWVGNSGGIMSVNYDTTYNEVVYILNNGSISCTINGATISDTYSGSIINNYNFYIFGKNGGGNSAERGNGYRLYYMKIYNNDTLVRNLVPCYRKSDNEIGLYDLVNSVFYTNAGSGTFTKGASVSSSEFLVESDLSTVAVSGDYDDLSNKPSIPTISASATAVSGATEAKSLNINGTNWNLPSGGGSGDVTGPSGCVDGNIVAFNGSTGKVIKDSGWYIDSSSIYNNYTGIAISTNPIDTSIGANKSLYLRTVDSAFIRLSRIDDNASNYALYPYGSSDNGDLGHSSYRWNKLYLKNSAQVGTSSEHLTIQAHSIGTNIGDLTINPAGAIILTPGSSGIDAINIGGKIKINTTALGNSPQIKFIDSYYNSGTVTSNYVLPTMEKPAGNYTIATTDDSLPIVNVSTSTQQLAKNKYYKFGDHCTSVVEIITITLPTQSASLLEEYNFEIGVDDYNLNLVVPAYITWKENALISSKITSGSTTTLNLLPGYKYISNIFGDNGIIMGIAYPALEKPAPTVNTTLQTINWTPITDATGYKITDTAGHSATVSGSSASYNYSSWYPTTKLSTPSPTASAVSTTSIKVSWNAITNAGGYTVYYKAASAATYSSVSTINASYTLTGLTAGTTYSIYVIATESNYPGTTFSVTATAVQHKDSTGTAVAAPVHYTKSDNSTTITATTPAA